MLIGGYRGIKWETKRIIGEKGEVVMLA